MQKWWPMLAVTITVSPMHAQQVWATTGSPSAGTTTISPMTVDAAVSHSTESDPSFDLSLGTSIAGGDFGNNANASIWSTSFGARAAISGLRLSASVPYMRVRSNGTIVSGIDSTPVIVSVIVPGRREVRRGLGDLTFGASYTVVRADSGLELEMSGRVKLPTATKSSQLSTGKTDLSAGLQVTKTIGRLAPFVSVTYRVFGDTPAYGLKNGFAASAGTSLIVNDRAVLLVSYHYAQAATKLIQNSHELFAGASTLLGKSKFRLTGFVTAGLSDGASAVSGGLALSLRLKSF